MAQIQKLYYLHELLQQDQEPFLLKNYIADKRYKLKKTSPKTLICHKNSNFRSNFTKNACFFSFHDVDTRKSPLFQAAVSVRQSKNRNQNKGFFWFSFLKRSTLTLRENISSGGRKKKSDRNIDEAVLGLSGSGSCVWSESNNNEDYKSTLDFDLETERSSSSQSEYEVLTAAGDEEKRFCESPFEFVLQSESSSPGRRTPEFLSAATSPAPTIKMDKEEDEEQCSPVSVLDPPFEDDDGDHYHELDEEDEDFNIESSFAIVQRAKQKLLRKLHRFERLAGLDPIELEKRMSEQLQDDYDDEYDNYLVDEESLIDDDQESNISSDSKNNNVVKQVLSKSSFRHSTKICGGMKKLISDLLVEEQKDSAVDSNLAMNRVCKRLESWKEVEFNTIDMMVEQDFKSDKSWKRNKEHVGEIATEIELAIFRILMQEVSEEN